MREQFTPAEKRTAALIVDGKTNAEIARHFGIKLKTVWNRTETMRRKWHATCDRHLAVMLAMESKHRGAA